VRLVDGASESAGRLEVQINGTWGTVCNTSWGQVQADITCAQLGYSGALMITTSGVAEAGGELPIWLDHVMCTGDEEFIWDCSNDGLGMHDCSHSEDVYIVCEPSAECT